MSDRLHLRLQASGSTSASLWWRRILSSGSSLLETRMPRGVWRVVLEKKLSARSGREPCLSATDLHLVGLGASEVGLPWCRMPVTPL